MALRVAGGSARTRVCHHVIGGGLRDAGNAHSAAVGALDVRPFPVRGCPGGAAHYLVAQLAKFAHLRVPLVRYRERLQAASGEILRERRGSSGSARRAMPGRRRRGGRSGLESASPPKQCGRTRAAGTLASRFHTRATTATIRAQLIAVPARIARSARRLRLHLPERWPWANAWQAMFTTAHGPPITAT